MMPTSILDPSETGGVEATTTGKGDPPRNAGTVARKATGRANVGRSAPIRKEPGPEMAPETAPDMPTTEIGSDRTTPKTLGEPETGQSS